MAEENDDDGIEAIKTIIAALRPLEPATRENVLGFVLKQLNIELPIGSEGSEQSPEKIFHPGAPPPPTGGVTDIRSLGEEKRPKTVNEKVAVVAYYLRNLAPPEQRRDYITAADIEPYFTEAGFLHPTGPANMTLANAKNAGYLNALGSGQYRLNPVGHNLVAHRLPAGEAASKKGAKPQRRKKPTKKRR